MIRSASATRWPPPGAHLVWFRAAIDPSVSPGPTVWRSPSSAAARRSRRRSAPRRQQRPPQLGEQRAWARERSFRVLRPQNNRQRTQHLSRAPHLHQNYTGEIYVQVFAPERHRSRADRAVDGSAGRGRHWRGRRPKASTSEAEAEDEARVVIRPARHGVACPLGSLATEPLGLCPPLGVEALEPGLGRVVDVAHHLGHRVVAGLLGDKRCASAGPPSR